MHIVRSTMRDMCAARGQDSKTIVRRIAAARARKWQDQHQLDLWFTDVFTDDSAAVVLGYERMTGYLVAWHEMITRLNILMAPPRKRQLGCVLRWIGAIFLTVGLVTTQLQKRLRAVMQLTA